MQKTSRNIRKLLAATTLLAAAPTLRVSANEAAHWNQVATELSGAEFPLDPLSESRVLAIVHLAMHDAANAVAPRFATFAPATKGGGGSAEIAVAAAAHAALRELIPGRASRCDIELENRTRHLGGQPGRGPELAIGREAAGRILAMRRHDGAANAKPWPAGKRPGEYRPTPPDWTPAAFSHWAEVRPFALRAPAQFRPVPPPAVGSAQALADLEEVRAIGSAQSAVRSFEQGEIAAFWYEASTQGWNRIAREVGLARKLDLWAHARMLALVNVAMVDGFIGGFEAKYHYNYWRPATAIREAGDADWINFLPTPPVPDYPSTHTVLGAAASAAMRHCLGTDYVTFAMTSGQPYPGITRRFWSLSDAARENGASRVFAGIHFTTAVQAGFRQGTEIGEWAAAQILQPLGKPAALTAAAAP